METTRSQRWRERRALWAADALVIDPRAYGIDLLPEAQARAFIAEHHYLATYPAALLAVGLFGRCARLEGVAVFAVPAAGAVITRHTGFADPAKGTVLARLILLDRVPQNGESFFCSRAFSLLRRERPHIEAVVSYSDPEPGTSDASMPRCREPRGLSKPRPVLRLGTRTLSGRTLSKIRLGERGAGGAIDQLVALGAPAPMIREEPAAWLQRLETEGHLTRRRHPCLFTYCFELTRAARRQAAGLPRLAYPRQLPCA